MLKSELILGEIGMNIFNPDEHFTMTNHSRVKLSLWIGAQMGITLEEVTDSIFNAWVSCQEDWDDISDEVDMWWESVSDMIGDRFGVYYNQPKQQMKIAAETLHT